MYWKVSCEVLASKEMTTPEGVAAGGAPDEGRFVLHRHLDGDGAHLDLRLEQEGYLLGWRIDGVQLDEERWATEKSPHPLHWLERDGDAVREDEGVYAWVERSAEGGTLELRGRSETRRLRVSKVRGFPARCAQSVLEAMARHSVEGDAVAGLIGDGLCARNRAIERLCGLGRELDGRAFDDRMWREVLSGRSLEDVQRHLHGFELRFDAKYPPQPVSQPEALEGEEEGVGRREQAMDILRD